MPANDPAIQPVHHLRYIDALRGLAVAAVIAVHTGGLAGVSWFGWGTKGVQLFYIISAFTLMMSMSKRDRREDAPHRNFFIRRFFRIAPAFYFILAVYCLLGWWGHSTEFTELRPVSFFQGVWVALFVNGWRPDIINWPVYGQWSIAVEMMFYVLLPFLFPLVTNFRRSVYAWTVAVVLSAVSRFLAVHLAAAEGFGNAPVGMLDMFGNDWLLTQLPIFMGGIGLYFIVQQRLTWKQYLLPYLPGSLLLVVLRRTHPDVGLLPILGILLMAAVAFLGAHPTRLLVNRATVLLGKVSFSAYLCHPLVLMALSAVPWRPKSTLFHHGLLRFSTLYSLTLSLTLLLSLLLWKAIELPGQQAGRRLIGFLDSQDSTNRSTKATAL